MEREEIFVIYNGELLDILEGEEKHLELNNAKEIYFGRFKIIINNYQASGDYLINSDFYIDEFGHVHDFSDMSTYTGTKAERFKFLMFQKEETTVEDWDDFFENY